MNTFRPKTIILVLIACLIAVASNAQMRAPENVPIGFYGKVLDQAGRPVIGATVTFDLITSHMAENRTETTPMTLHTDHDGRFALTGVTAYGIDRISIREDGYDLSQKASSSYVFGHKVEYKPNPNEPVIFRMWKTAGKEQLAGSAWHGKIACDGTTGRFDLRSGHPSPDGSLEITCTRTPLNFEMTSDRPFTYKLEISIRDGGVQPTEDEFTYKAPERGYSRSITIERKPGNPSWGGGLKQEFYIKTDKGEYGRLSVEWDAGHRPAPTPLKWDCSINPSGSRNLER
jgi:hypothetical protein